MPTQEEAYTYGMRVSTRNKKAIYFYVHTRLIVSIYNLVYVNRKLFDNMVYIILNVF